MEGGYEQHGIVFSHRNGTSHTLLRTTIWAVNDPMLLNSGKNALTQQSTSMGERFLLLDDGDRAIWQSTTSDLVVTFLVQNRMVWIELAIGRHEGANNNTQKDNMS